MEQLLILLKIIEFLRRISFLREEEISRMLLEKFILYEIWKFTVVLDSYYSHNWENSAR